MKKKLAFAMAAITIVVVVVSAFAALSSQDAPKKPFYLGVTYCGQSTDEAHQLIDRVKNFTNFFVIQSGPLQTNISALRDIGDYAVNSGLALLIYMGNYHYQQANVTAFLNALGNRWGSHLLGLYFGDEPGGKMLDAQTSLTNPDTGCNVQKDPDAMHLLKPGSDNIDIAYYYSGIVTIETSISYTKTPSILDPYSNTTTYYPNGTVVVTENYVLKSPTEPNDALIYQQDSTVTLRKADGSTSIVTNRGDITQFETYQQVWDSRPIKTYSDAASLYQKDLADIMQWLHNQTSLKTFTSDYGLYWFDYKGGYDTVLAQLGPNDNKARDIALLRGAANLQAKDWGTILTSTSVQTPKLLTGEEMYADLELSYEQGAKYAVVFNYAPSGDGVGLLQDEHFAAIERFWREVVENPKETNNVAVHTALVLPANYGWGMRSANDTIWGIWQPDDKAPQVSDALQNVLANKNRLIDIVYDDSAYPAAAKYSQLLFWNQTT